MKTLLSRKRKPAGFSVLESLVMLALLVVFSMVTVAVARKYWSADPGGLGEAVGIQVAAPPVTPTPGRSPTAPPPEPAVTPPPPAGKAGSAAAASTKGAP